MWLVSSVPWIHKQVTNSSTDGKCTTRSWACSQMLKSSILILRMSMFKVTIRSCPHRRIQALHAWMNHSGSTYLGKFMELIKRCGNVSARTSGNNMVGTALYSPLFSSTKWLGISSCTYQSASQYTSSLDGLLSKFISSMAWLASSINASPTISHIMACLDSKIRTRSTNLSVNIIHGTSPLHLNCSSVWPDILITISALLDHTISSGDSMTHLTTHSNGKCVCI